MNQRRRPAALLALLLSLLAPGSAPRVEAEPAPAPLRPSLDERRAWRVAEELTRTAREVQATGDLAEALSLYQAAYRVMPTSLLLWPMAELYLHLDQPIAGLLALDRYTEELGPPPGPPAQVTQPVEQLRERLRRRVARLAVRSDPPPTELLIDGRPVLSWDRPVQVDPGPHHLVARGARTVEQDIRVGPGQALDLSLGPAARGRRWPWSNLSAGRLVGLGVLSGLFLAGLTTAITLSALDGRDHPGGGCTLSGVSYGACVYNLAPAAGLTYGVSALLLGGAATIVFLPPRHKEASRAR